MLVACDLALALGALARQARKQNIQRVVHLGTTQCRTIADTQVLSQHAFGRAIDISAFHLDNGRVVRVLQDWERGQPQPRTQPGRLLRDFAMALHRDQVFNVVLTPEYNEAHWDHFHLDLTRDRHFLSQGPADILVGD